MKKRSKLLSMVLSTMLLMGTLTGCAAGKAAEGGKKINLMLNYTFT